MDTLFSLANLYILPFWLLMIFLPHWRVTRRIVGSLWVVIPLAVLYAVLILPGLAVLLPGLANPALANIAALLGTPAGATIGWIHFLAFDLFVGRWAYLDSRERGLSAWLASPALFFILMVGPLGLLLYLAARAMVTRQRT
jgi:hypothetical protein